MSCTGKLDSIFYAIPPANLTNWEEHLSTKDEFDDMKDLFQDYCRQISKDESYKKVFGQLWWKEKNETLTEDTEDYYEEDVEDRDEDDEEDLIKNLGWYMPGQQFDKREARRKKTAEIFKCCRMRVYYPEKDKGLDDRLPLVESMTVHLESDMERYYSDRSEAARKVFGLGETEYVAVQDESIALPPSEFWWYYDHEDYGQNKLTSIYDYEPADDQPSEQMWNKGYKCRSKQQVFA